MTKGECSDPKRVVRFSLNTNDIHETYYIHESHLRENSTYYANLLDYEANLLDGRIQKKKDQEVCLTDVEQSVFEAFSTFVYTKKVEVEEMEAAESLDSDEPAMPTMPTTPTVIKAEPSDVTQQQPVHGPLRMSLGQFSRLSRDDRVYARLLNLYGFGEKIGSIPFKLAILARMLQFYTARLRLGGKLPAISVVKYGVSFLGTDSEACKRLARWYALHGHAKLEDQAALASLPAEFLAEVVRALFDRVSQVPSVKKSAK